MELRQLRHFVAVAEEGSFTVAAQRMNIVQSALSTSVRSLEDELDAKLFARTTRHVRLTAAGRAFLGKAREALDAIRQGREMVADIAALRRGKLSIGTVQSLPAFVDLPALLARFHGQYPDIEVHLCQGSASHLMDKVRAGKLDFAILPIGEPPAQLATTQIACESLVLACARGHRLAGMAEVSLATLAGEPFVDFEPAHGTRRLADRGFGEAGVERRIAFEVSDLDTLLALVARGLGVALVPQAVAEARGATLSFVPLAAPEICWELVVAYAEHGKTDGHGLDAAPGAFLELLVGRGAAAPGREPGAAERAEALPAS